MNAKKLLARATPQETLWTGTFEGYLDRVLKTPSIADLAHTRVYKALVAHRATFDAELFGMGPIIDRLMEYFRSAGEGQATRQQMLLLAGPPGSAKSTAVYLTKRALEAYSRTDEGAVYAIVGCPLHEEPLHLLDDAARKELLTEGIRVEGGLCPVCVHRMDTEWNGDIANVPVERILIAEDRRKGIGSFAPGDPKIVSLEDMVGRMKMNAVMEFGSEAHPLAFDFNGAFEHASRGIYEFLEIFKADSTLILPLITLIQEHQIKAGSFALFYSDEVVLTHTNLAEYDKFLKEPRNEAIRDRTLTIRVPYLTTISDEVKVYQKLIGASSNKSHLAPHALEVAATFAVMSRLKPVAELTEGRDNMAPGLLAKARIYDGKDAASHPAAEVDAWRRTGREEGEGMTGVGPRPVANALAQALSRSQVSCLNAVDVLRALKDLPQSLSGEYNKAAHEGIIKEVILEYTQAARQDVQQAFVEDFDDAAQTLLLNYLDNAAAALRNTTIQHPITGEPLPPDEKLMASIEAFIGVSGSQAKEFRREIYERVGLLARGGKDFRWDSHPRLKEAIQKKLFEDLAGSMKVTLTTPTPDKTTRERIDNVEQRLIAKGYCAHCARAALSFIGQTMRR